MSRCHEWQPCEVCAAKLGAYVLCASCLHNRTVIQELQMQMRGWSNEAAHYKAATLHMAEALYEVLEAEND